LDTESIRRHRWRGTVGRAIAYFCLAVVGVTQLGADEPGPASQPSAGTPAAALERMLSSGDAVTDTAVYRILYLHGAQPERAVGIEPWQAETDHPLDLDSRQRQRLADAFRSYLGSLEAPERRSLIVELRGWIDTYRALKRVEAKTALEIFHMAAFSLDQTRDIYYPILKSGYGYEHPEELETPSAAGNLSSSQLFSVFLLVVDRVSTFDGEARTRYLQEIEETAAELSN